MLKRLFVFILIATTFYSCKKDAATCAYQPPTEVATSAEISYLQNYLSTNSIAAIQHPSGVYYVITNPGTGSSPSVCSVIQVDYAGYLLNGTRFDFTNPGTPAKFTLGGLIKGWQAVLPLLKKGGTITLYIPPSLAYGNNDIRDQNGSIVIPANSYLKFTIGLADVL